MTELERSTSFGEVCEQLVELTAQAAEHVHRQAVSGNKPLPIVGQFFEDLANAHLDIAQVISALNRQG